jgi:hypothetical protein
LALQLPDGIKVIVHANLVRQNHVAQKLATHLGKSIYYDAVVACLQVGG